MALTGDEVVFIERPEAAAELRRRGMVLDLRADRRRHASEPLVVPPGSIRFLGSLEEALEFGPFDAALYALKSFDTPAAMDAVRPLADRVPPIVCFSNGVENETAIAREVGEAKVVAATITTAIGRRGPGDIILERLRGVGVASSHGIATRIVDSANTALLNARVILDAAAMKWSKMLTNLIANPTSAILDMTPGEVLRHPGLYRLEIGMLRECLAVMDARDIPVVDLPGTPVRALAAAIRLPTWVSRPFLVKAAGGGRGNKMPSFHIDLYSGRGKSEVEYLHGAVVRAGAATGTPTPINSFLTETLMALTVGELPLDEFARNPDKLLRAASVPRS